MEGAPGGGEQRRAARVEPPSEGPDLIFAVVRPAGTPDGEFFDKLAGELVGYGYHTERIKLSAILSDSATENGRPAPSDPEDERVGALMDEGDLVCAQAEQAAAVAILGLSEIQSFRLENASHPRVAYVIDSLKRPAETTFLRQIYGNHLVVIGLQASAENRRTNLLGKIKPQRPSMPVHELERLIQDLLDRDLEEPADDFGQNTLKTFPLADVFIDVEKDLASQVTHLVDLLFGNPNYVGPGDDELGMELAFVSGTRSTQLGLKVGAALMLDGRVVGLGMNEHPKPTGAPDYDSSAVDIKELLVDTLVELGDALGPDAQRRMAEGRDAYATELLNTKLKDAKIRDLTEFQPTVHAEMSALLDAVGHGRDLTGSTMYVTTYPCHGCAKHLIALDMRIVYLEPYPKSRAASMYGPSVEATFRPFTGVAPRRFQQLYDVTSDRKAPDGSRLAWGPAEKRLAQPKVDRLVDRRGIIDRETAALKLLELDEPAP